MHCVQSVGVQSRGSVTLDLDLLKQWRVLASAAAPAHNDNKHPLLHHAKPQQAPKVWLEYAYRKHHPALQWLLTMLAEWISENLKDDLGFSDKADPRRGWTPTKLNNLDRHAVRDRNGCALRTFGCIEGKMLPFQDAQAQLSRYESSGKKG